MYGDDAPTLDEVLQHYGVKGMHWGHRKASSSGDSGGSGGGAAKKPVHQDITRAERHAAVRDHNKQTVRKLEDWNDSSTFKTRDVRNNDIKAARKGMREATRTYKDIKKDVKRQKKAGELGKNEAKLAIAKAANVHWEQAYKAQQHTTGEAAVHLALGVLGAVSR